MASLSQILIIAFLAIALLIGLVAVAAIIVLVVILSNKKKKSAPVAEVVTPTVEVTNDPQ